MKPEKIEVHNLSIGTNFLHALKSHEFVIELLPPEHALRYYSMCEEHFYECIENGTLISFNIDGITLVPIFVADPSCCAVCECLHCICDQQGDVGPRNLPTE